MCVRPDAFRKREAVHTVLRRTSRGVHVELHRPARSCQRNHRGTSTTAYSNFLGEIVPEAKENNSSTRPVGRGESSCSTLFFGCPSVQGVFHLGDLVDSLQRVSSMELWASRPRAPSQEPVDRVRSKWSGCDRVRSGEAPCPQQPVAFLTLSSLTTTGLCGRMHVGSRYTIRLRF